MTHVSVSKLSLVYIMAYRLVGGRHQTSIWTTAGIWLIWTFGTNFSEILSTIHTFSFKKMHLKMSSVKWWPFCLGLNVVDTFPDIAVKLYSLSSLRSCCVIVFVNANDASTNWKIHTRQHILSHAGTPVIKMLYFLIDNSSVNVHVTYTRSMPEIYCVG